MLCGFSVTKLDAAEHYSSEHLDEPENWNLVEKAKGKGCRLTHTKKIEMNLLLWTVDCLQIPWYVS
jgi:hypothetical protein